MKKKLFSSLGQTKNGFLRPMIALSVAAALIAATPVVNGVARAVDLDKECALTVMSTASTDEEWVEDISKTNLVVDLYKVADAKAVSNIDTYTYDPVGSFASLTIGDDLDSDAFKLLSQEAAKIAVGGETILTPTISGANVNTVISSVEAGLYLIIARGSEVAEYVEEIETEDGSKNLVTLAFSDEYKYMFLPELVSLPTKAPDENGEIRTSNEGDWLYEQVVTLKGERTVAYGGIEIEKTLLTYVEGYNADFVFEVEAYLGEKNVYSNVVSLNFTKPGKKSVLVDKIPVGAEVIVTEVYSGASYKIVSDNSVKTVIVAGETAKAEFINDSETGKKGGAITNHFTYDGSGWSWEQQVDSTAGSAE